jgi:hypothetical protein
MKFSGEGANPKALSWPGVLVSSISSFQMKPSLGETLETTQIH